MTDTAFLTRLKTLLSDLGTEKLYPCIQDLIQNGPAMGRFAAGDRTPQRQDITQYLAAWCRHAGLLPEECREWLIDYCVTRLAPISKTSIGGIRHSTKSNVKYIFRSEVSFLCDCEDNPFRAHCSVNCPVHDEMQAKLAERRERAANVTYEVQRREPVAPVPFISVKEKYKDEFQAALQFIRQELEKGTKSKVVVKSLIDGGFKTRTGREWNAGTYARERALIRKEQSGRS